MSSMQYKFEKFNKNNVLMSILMVILGENILISPEMTLNFLDKMVGILILDIGTFSLITWFIDKKWIEKQYLSLTFSVLCFIAGLLFYKKPISITTQLPKLIGIAIIINGLFNLSQSFEMKKYSSENWIPSMIMALLTILVGIYLLLHAFSAIKVAVMFIGGIFIYNGASNLWIESRYRKAGK